MWGRWWTPPTDTQEEPLPSPPQLQQVLRRASMTSLYRMEEVWRSNSRPGGGLDPLPSSVWLSGESEREKAAVTGDKVTPEVVGFWPPSRSFSLGFYCGDSCGCSVQSAGSLPSSTSMSLQVRQFCHLVVHGGDEAWS